MPRKGSRKSGRSGLSRSQKMEVKKIASQVVDAEIEDKRNVFITENVQLFHNKPLYVGKLLANVQQGVTTGDDNSSKTNRVGDQITLKNANIRFWMSNKLDRPNCMYKGVLFWYPVDSTISDALVYLTQTNKMLDRYNYKSIQIVDSFILKSTQMYLNGTEKFEHSYLASLNKTYKNKKIQYQNNSTKTKSHELGFAVVVYDAFGTQQTDNIASIAYNIQLTFQDA